MTEPMVVVSAINSNPHQEKVAVMGDACGPAVSPRILGRALIRLNVGGKMFVTRRSTLAWVPNSFLATLVSGRFAADLDAEGNIFIDRDPTHFETILNWLRDRGAPKAWQGACHLDPALQHELEYYGLADVHAQSLKDRVMVFGGEVPGGGSLNSVEVFVPETLTWNLHHDMPFISVNCHSCALVDGHVYVTGGVHASQRETEGGVCILATTMVFNVAADMWSSAPSMPTPRFNHLSLGFKDRLYVIGGRDQDQAVMSSVLHFDTQSRTWGTSPSLSQARCLHNGTVLGSRLYVVGGHVGEEGTVSIEVLEVGNAAWQEVPAPNHRHVVPGVFALNDCLFLVAGDHMSTYMEKYDPVTENWTTLAAIPHYHPAYEYPQCAVLNGRAFIFPSIYAAFTESTTSLVYEYDQDRDCWLLHTAPMAQSRNMRGLVVVPPHVRCQR